VLFPVRTKQNPEDASLPTAAHCFSTKSANFPAEFKQNFFVQSKTAS
jgi:hypothetical protein